MNEVHVTHRQTGALQRLGSLFDLGKLGIVEMWLGLLVAGSLLGERAFAERRTLSILVLSLVTTIAVIAVTCSLDDITGARDGVDRANHRGRPRWGVKKPLLDGRLNEQSALRVAAALVPVVALGVIGTLVIAWPLPAWLIGAIVAVVFLAVNYSYGLKLSYLGAGEVVYFLATAATVLFPYALVERRCTWTVLANAALVGSWHVQVMVFSNSADAPGDRAKGRRTLAARLSKRANRVFIAVLFAVSWALTAAAFLAGILPPVLAYALLPVWALQAHQVWLGVGQQSFLSARVRGFQVVRIGAIALLVANVLAASVTDDSPPRSWEPPGLS